MKLGSVRIVVLGTLVLLFAMFLALMGNDGTITWFIQPGTLLLKGLSRNREGTETETQGGNPHLLNFLHW